MHWFVDNFKLYTGSVRGLFISDFSTDYEAYVESAIISLRSRGIEPFVATGEQLVMQAEKLWAQATQGTPFNQPMVSMFELDMLRSEVTFIKDLEAPVNAQQLWYLFHYIFYPRALFNKATIVTTSLGLDEFIAYGAECDDIEFSGRKISWERLTWLIEATMIDLYQFRQVKTDGHPPMLKAEYNLFKAMNERELPVTAQQVLGDYMLDMSIADRDNRLAIECDVLSSVDPNVPNSGEAKKNLVLLSDGWKILRFSTAEILGDLTACVDAVEQVWSQGRKKSAVGRLMSGRDQPKIPELPVDDDSQKLAITHGAGPVAVTGGAGTGKTSTITHRIGYLLAQGVCPERILVFSYSEETIGQLKRQVEMLTDAQTVLRLNFSNWKDLGLRILKENAAVIKRKPPLKVETTPHRVLQRVLKKEMKDIDPLQLELMSSEIDEISVGSLISLYKANLVTPERIKERGTTDEDDLVAKLYMSYEDTLKKSNKVDSDDMISLCAQILADDADVRAKYQHKFEYVLVDEYQECTAAADLMARLLAFPQDNLFLVGDEDECVSEAKGALPRLMADTSIRMPNARCYILDKNWRSHPAIVDHSRSLSAALAFKGIPKDMLPGFGQAATSAVIGPQQCRSEEAEADWVANEVSILIESGKSPNDIVLLWRNPRYASLLEGALFKKGIKCANTTVSSDAVPDEVGDVMAFLRLVMDPDGPKSRASFERFCQLKSREMDQKLSKLSNTIASFAEANNLSFLKAIEIYHDATADSSCEDLAQLVRIVRTMNQENLPPAQTIGLLKRTQKLNEIYSAVKVPPGVVYEPMRKVEQLEEEAKAYSSVREFVKAKQDFLQSKDTNGEDSSVQIKSFEDAKGIESPIAFLTGMAEGLSPAEAANDFEEERRLCYVAMTRAKELLYVSYPGSFEEKPLPPSPFLVEARLLPINVYRKAVDLIRAEPLPKSQPQAEPAAPASTMLTPIFTGRPDRTKPAAERGNRSPGGPQDGSAQARPQTYAPGSRPAAPGRPGSDVADLLGGGSRQASSAPSSQPIIRPAGHTANLERAASAANVAQPENPFVGPEIDQGRVVDEARQRAENEAKLKAQYEAHVQAQHNAQNQAALETQRRAEQAAMLQAMQEQQIREQQEAVMRARQADMDRRAQEEVQRREQYEARLRAQQEAELRAQKEAELLAYQEGERLAREAAERKAREEAELKAREEADRLAKEAQIVALIQQEAALRARQEAQQLAEQQAAMQAQQEAQQLAEQQAAMQAQQDAQRMAEQQAAMRAQQEAQQLAEQQAAMQAQQEAQRMAEQQAAMQAQQEAQRMAAQQAAMQAQQEAQQMAEQQTVLRAQQETQQMAAQQAAMQAQQAAIQAQQPENQVLSQAQYEALISQKQFTPNGAETGFPVSSQSEEQAEAALKAKQEALHRVQEKAAQRAMIDLELRMQQEVAVRTGETAPVAQSAVDTNEDINRLVNEQFDFGARSTSPPQEPSTPAIEKEADPERVKDENVVRSNKEILEDMSPAEREKQQDVLRKKAREKLVAKGRKKKGGSFDEEPPQEVAPAAVESPTPAVEDVRVESREAPPAVAAPEGSRPHSVGPGPEPAESPQVDTGPLPPVVPPYDAMGRPVAEPIGRKDDIQPVPVSQDMFEQGADAAGRGLPSAPGPSPPPGDKQPLGGEMPGALLSPSASGITIHNLQKGLNPELPELNFLAPEKSAPPPLVIEETVPAPLPVESHQPSYAPVQAPSFPLSQDVQPPNPQMYAPLPPHPQPEIAYTQQQEYTPVLPQAAPPQEFPSTLPPPVAPQPIPSSTLPQCPGCALPLEPNARFCGECGYQLQVRIQGCPSCQLPLEPSAKFCGECGYSLQ